MRNLFSYLIASTVLTLCFASTQTMAQEMWRGLVAEKENRCSPYDKKSQYPYPQSIEDVIVAQMDGKIYGPYTGRYFSTDRETDIEHIVATTEGHDSGLCRASAATRKAFATDPLNLTLAAPEVNRCGSSGKCGLDAGEWLPLKNRCWFANRVVEIKQKYRLSVDRQEMQSLQGVIERCDNFDMIFYDDDGSVAKKPGIMGKAGSLFSTFGNKEKVTEFTDKARDVASQTVDDIKAKYALEMYDDNKNGRITCAEARAHGIAPVDKSHPAYPFMYDADGDGTVCE